MRKETLGKSPYGVFKKTDEIDSNYCQLFISKPSYKTVCVFHRDGLKVIERQILAYVNMETSFLFFDMSP